MRTIKFRGKRIDNGEWIIGNYQTIIGKTNMLIRFDISDKRQHEYKEIDLDIHLITKTILPEEQGWDFGDCIQFYEVIPETVGQFTGLTDKTGKEIYEGDIIERLYKYEVIFERGSFYGRGSNNTRLTAKEISNDMVVIGNIHDNPELLK